MAQTSTTGVDWYGYTRTSVQLITGKTLRVGEVRESRQPVTAHAQDAWLSEAAALTDLLPSKPGQLTVAVPDGGAPLEFKTTPHRTALAVLDARADFVIPTEGSVGGLPPTDAVVVPIPRRQEGLWAALVLPFRPLVALGVLNDVQSDQRSLRPTLCPRALAPLRALLARGTISDKEVALFVHLDQWETIIALFTRGNISYVQRSQTGIVHIAAAVAADTRVSFADAVAAVYEYGLSAAGEAATTAYTKQMAMVLGDAVQRMRTVTPSGPHASGREAPRNEPMRVNRVVLSGPLTDDPRIADLPLPGRPHIELFRPLAELAPERADVRQIAGRLTVAYGLALETGIPSDHDALVADITPLLPLSILPASRRDATGLPPTHEEELRRRRRQGGTRTRQTISPAVQRKVRPVLYFASASLAGVTTYPLAKGMWITRETRQLSATAEQLKTRLASDEQARETARDLAQRMCALSTIHNLRTSAVRVLDATAAVAGHSSERVWLTRIDLGVPGTILFTGRADDPQALATFLDALKTDSTFRDVKFQSSVPARSASGGYVFTVTAGVMPRGEASTDTVTALTSALGPCIAEPVISAASRIGGPPVPPADGAGHIVATQPLPSGQGAGVDPSHP